jgi:hypothetical protein
MKVAVVGIGKSDSNFGWAMVGDTTAEGNDIDVCVQSLVTALRNGPLALGFEALMFVPIRTGPEGPDSCSQWHLFDRIRVAQL